MKALIILAPYSRLSHRLSTRPYFHARDNRLYFMVKVNLISSNIVFNQSHFLILTIRHMNESDFQESI